MSLDSSDPAERLLQLRSKPLGADRLPRCRVLLIEDDPDDVALIARQLGGRPREFQLITVDRLAAGLAHLKEASPDVLLLDLALPDSRGLETLQRVRASVSDVPIVVLSGRDDDAVALEALRNGAADYLVKGRLDPRRLMRTLRYASERGRTQSRLKASSEKFRLMFERSPLGIALCNSDGSIVHANATFQRLSRCPATALHGRQIRDLLAPTDGLIKQALLGRHGASGGPGEGELIRADGSRMPIVSTWVTVDEPNGSKRIWFTIEDQSERKRTERKLMQLSLYDGLTGLANRNMFQITLVKALGRSERSGSKLAVLFLDLDRFKAVNDTLGHEAGDALLIAVGSRLIDEMRVGDQVARLGGDEFGIILENLRAPDDANIVAQKLVDALGPPFEVDGQTVQISGSVGIALYPDHATDAAGLARLADVAMYKAKEKGRGGYCYYSESIDRELNRRVGYEKALQYALRRREFVLYYQPQIELGSGRVVCLETLLRWNHPVDGLISAAQFVPYLESSGLIKSVGRWVLREACQALHGWQQRLGRRDLRIAVNLSSRQLGRSRLVRDVREALSEAQLAPESLELEITESLLLANPEHAIDVLRQLSLSGVHIAIDDFGTGYSSLQYMKLLPLQALKIDRSFLAGVPANPSDVAIVRGIIAMARSLGLELIAEGVENHAQMEFLAAEQCERVQGYLIGRPLVGDAVVRFIAAHREPAHVP